MEQVDVEILGQVITAQYGTLSTGDVLRTSPEFAKHLVEDCAAAKYRKPVTQSVVPKAPVKTKTPKVSVAKVTAAATGSNADPELPPANGEDSPVAAEGVEQASASGEPGIPDAGGVQTSAQEDGAIQ